MDFETIKQLTNKTTTFPLMSSYVKEFLWEGLIISVPPGSTNIAGNRMNPVWFVKKDGNEICGENLQAEDWKRKVREISELGMEYIVVMATALYEKCYFKSSVFTLKTAKS